MEFLPKGSRWLWVAQEQACSGDYSSLAAIAAALHQLQLTYGYAGRLLGKGIAACQLRGHLERARALAQEEAGADSFRESDLRLLELFLGGSCVVGRSNAIKAIAKALLRSLKGSNGCGSLPRIQHDCALLFTMIGGFDGSGISVKTPRRARRAVRQMF